MLEVSPLLMVDCTRAPFVVTPAHAGVHPQPGFPLELALYHMVQGLPRLRRGGNDMS
jgi:hypothetical protein